MVKLGMRTRFRMVAKDYRAKHGARRATKYWEWVNGRKSYLLAPRMP